MVCPLHLYLPTQILLSLPVVIQDSSAALQQPSSLLSAPARSPQQEHKLKQRQQQRQQLVAGLPNFDARIRSVLFNIGQNERLNFHKNVAAWDGKYLPTKCYPHVKGSFNNPTTA